MASLYPPSLIRLADFSRDFADGLGIDASALDAEFNQVLIAFAILTSLMKGITNADGSLKFTAPLREMKLIEVITATGVAGSSQVVTVPTYNPATDLAEVFVNGLKLEPGAVSYTDSTHITITHVFAGGENIDINLYSNGAGALSQLASTIINEGASLVGIHDAGGLYVSTTVEAALAEVMTDLNTFISNVGTIANYIQKNGSVAMAASLSMGNHTITNLANGVNPTDAVAMQQLTFYTNIWNNLSANFLALGGGTMSGAINMGNQQINNVADPTSTQDAATKHYVDAQLNSGQTPVGMVTAFVGLGSNIPSGWLLCDGSAISRTAYPNLNAVMATAGYPFGDGDGSTTFNIPDCQGRTIIGAGAGSGLTARTMGSKGGEEAHVLLTAEMPAHYHTAGYSTNEFGGGSLGAFTNDNHSGPQPTSNAIDSGDHTTPASNQPHNNMQPWVCCAYIIRVG